MATKKKSRIPSVSPRRVTLSKLSANPFDHLKLSTIRLLGLNASLEISGETPTLERLELKGTTTVGCSEDGNHVFVDGVITAKVLPLLKESESHASVQVHLQCVYELSDVTTEEFEPAAHAIVASSMMAMWPHFREIIQSATSRMNISPIMLPMLIPGHPLGGRSSKGSPIKAVE